MTMRRDAKKTRVVLCGLKSSLELNGSEGRVCSDWNGGRYNVKLVSAAEDAQNEFVRVLCVFGVCRNFVLTI